jgi:vacuole morphology and inheritance protein 14
MYLVCMLSTKSEKYSRKVMEQLIERFYSIRSQAKFDDKIKQVIQELTNSISQEKVFMEFAGKLDTHHDLLFVSELIERLTFVIVASNSYSRLRSVLMGQIKTMEYAETKEELFFALFKTWSYNPVSTLTLCLLTKNYELAYRLMPRFTQIEMDTSKLIALGSLV